MDMLAARKDLPGEKTWDAAQRIGAACQGRFKRRVVEWVEQGSPGRILEVVSGFHHSADLDPTSFRLDWRPAFVYTQL